MNAEQKLRLVLRPDNRGIRTAVPVVGCGVNIQAARIEGLKEDGWRARNFVPFKEDQIPATLYLKHKGEACPELMGGPCEIQTIEFDSYDELWNAFFNACERPEC